MSYLYSAIFYATSETRPLPVHRMFIHVTCTTFSCPGGSSTTGRAQRASARNVTTAPLAPYALAPDGITAMSSMQSIIDFDPYVMPVDPDPPSISRSNSVVNLEDGLSSAPNGKTKGTRRDKGKGKEIDKSLIRVKEEEMGPPSLSPDSAAGPVRLFLSILFPQH